MESEADETARRRKFFNTIDTDGDGTITVSELQSRLKDMSRMIGGPVIDDKIAQKYAEELIDLAEVGSKTVDRRVDFHEFSSFLKSKELKLKNLFDTVDLTGDGTIDKEELLAAMSRIGIKLGKSDLELFVNKIDKDGSGTISFSEFRDFCLCLPTAMDLTTIFTQYQQMYDPSINLEITPHVAGAFTWNGFFAGAIAGAASRTSTAPFDRLRVFFQTGGSGSFAEAVKTITSQGGIKAFWRGNGLNVVKVAPESAIMFSALDQAKKMIASWEGKTEKNMSAEGKFFAGSIAGLVAQTATYPLDTLKTRIMSNVSSSGSGGAEKGVGGVIRDMLAEGPSAFFRGLIPASIGVIPYAGINMGVFENLKTAYIAKYPETKEIPVGAILGIGCLSGSMACVAVYPLQVIRTRMQSQGSPSNPLRYNGIGDCIKVTMAKEGVKGFYKGLVATLTKVVPSAGVSFASFEMAKRWLNVK